MENNTHALFVSLGMMKEGHFLRSSGRHTDWYVQCARLFENPAQAQTVCGELARQFQNAPVDIVMSAAIGGILTGYEVAKALRRPHIFCERKDGAMTLRRGFMIQNGQKVLLVEDEVTTGASIREMTEIVRALGGEVTGIACLVDKSGGKLSFDAPFHALVTQQTTTYRETQCPLCRAGVPLERV